MQLKCTKNEEETGGKAMKMAFMIRENGPFKRKKEKMTVYEGSRGHNEKCKDQE